MTAKNFSLRHYLSVGYYSFKLALQRQIEYPMFLVSWFLMNPIKWFGGVYMLHVIISNFQPIQGWTLPEIVFLYSLSLLSHGLHITLFIQIWFIGRMVIQGGFDRMLLQPISPFYSFSVMYINVIGFSDLFPGLILFAYASHTLNIEWDFLKILSVFIVVGSGTLLRAGVYLIVDSMSFWNKGRWTMAKFIDPIMSQTSNYPLSIYPRRLQDVLTFILPIGFLAYYPALDILDKPSDYFASSQLLTITVAISISFFLLGMTIFHQGLKHYESTGN